MREDSIGLAWLVAPKAEAVPVATPPSGRVVPLVFAAAAAHRTRRQGRR